MLQRRVPRDYRSNLDRELKRRRCQIIVAEVEVSYARVAIKCIDNVTATLVRDPTVRQIKHTQLESLQHEVRKLSAGSLCQATSSDVEQVELF